MTNQNVCNLPYYIKKDIYVPLQRTYIDRWPLLIHDNILSHKLVGSEKKKGKLNVMYIKLVFEHRKLYTISK